MKLSIVEIGDPILRQTARELSVAEITSPLIQDLIQAMKKTMHEAPGVGLAAPQIGESLQLIVIEDKPDYVVNFSAEELKKRERVPVPFHVLINPKLTIKETEIVEFYEGCLSMAGFVSLVPRALCVEVSALNEEAKPVTIKARGWYARILQHEIDHLKGTLCIDKMKIKSLTTSDNYNKYYK